jgi:hypothetical protein
MDAKEAADLIEAAGGDSAFAQLLGLTEQPGFQQRVNNWKRRGIPARVALEHRRVLESLQRKVKVAA